MWEFLMGAGVALISALIGSALVQNAQDRNMRKEPKSDTD